MTDTTVQAFFDCCQTRGADTYFYVNPSNCAFAQFLKDTDICPNPMVGPYDWFPFGNTFAREQISDEIQDALREASMRRDSGEVDVLTFANIRRSNDRAERFNTILDIVE